VTDEVGVTECEYCEKDLDETNLSTFQKITPFCPRCTPEKCAKCGCVCFGWSPVKRAFVCDNDCVFHPKEDGYYNQEREVCRRD